MPFLWDLRRDLSLLGLGFPWQKNSLDVWEYSTLGDGHSWEKFVQFLVISDSELEMSWDDPGLLVVTGSVTSELQDLSCEVFHDCSQVDWGTSSYALSIVAFPQKSVDTSNWELKSSSGWSWLGLSLDLASLTTSRHDLFDIVWCVLVDRFSKTDGEKTLLSVFKQVSALTISGPTLSSVR